jgi:hypothetical protein
MAADASIETEIYYRQDILMTKTTSEVLGGGERWATTGVGAIVGTVVAESVMYENEKVTKGLVGTTVMILAGVSEMRTKDDRCETVSTIDTDRGTDTVRHGGIHGVTMRIMIASEETGIVA